MCALKSSLSRRVDSNFQKYTLRFEIIVAAILFFVYSTSVVSTSRATSRPDAIELSLSAIESSASRKAAIAYSCESGSHSLSLERVENCSLQSVTRRAIGPLELQALSLPPPILELWLKKKARLRLCAAFAYYVIFLYTREGERRIEKGSDCFGLHVAVVMTSWKNGADKTVDGYNQIKRTARV